jgi:hypothetical protein
VLLPTSDLSARLYGDPLGTLGCDDGSEGEDDHDHDHDHGGAK